MAKISVIIPVYGVENYIERCVESLFQQTMNDIEYIFVDDCSTDRSIEILENKVNLYRHRLIAEDKVVRIIKMPFNSGQAAVRLAGLKHASGEYIIHCDSDDWIHIDMYRNMYTRATKDEADVVICDFNITDGVNFYQNIKACYSESSDQVLYDMLYHKTSWAVWNKLIKKDLYSSISYYPEYAMGEDMVIITQILLNATKISYIEEGLYYYYFNPNSIMNMQTEEHCLSKYTQLKLNTESLLPILSYKLDKYRFDKIKKVLSYNITIPLFPYLHKKEFFDKWKQNMLPYYGILFDRKVKLTFKLMYLLIFSRIYQLYKYLKNA